MCRYMTHACCSLLFHRRRALLAPARRSIFDLPLVLFFSALYSRAHGRAVSRSTMVPLLSGLELKTVSSGVRKAPTLSASPRPPIILPTRFLILETLHRLVTPPRYSTLIPSGPSNSPHARAVMLCTPGVAPNPSPTSTSEGVVPLLED